MAKDLLTHAARIDQSTRVLVLGDSSACYRSSPPVDVKSMLKLFQTNGKCVLLSYPDYMSRLKLWSHFIEQSVSENSSVYPKLTIRVSGWTTPRKSQSLLSGGQKVPFPALEGEISFR